MTCSFQACTVGMQEYHQLANLIHCFVSLNEGIMPGRKFRLSVHRKNEERKKWKPKRVVKISVKNYQRSPSLVVSIPLSSLPEPDGYNVSLPLSAYTSHQVDSVETLNTRLKRIDLPQLWFVATSNPLTLCKTRPQPTPAIAADVNFTITINEQFEWTLSVFKNSHVQLDAFASIPVPVLMRNIDVVLHLITFLDACKLCHGNSNENMIEVWRYRSRTSHGAGRF